MQQSKTEALGSAPVGKLLFKLAAPAIAAQIINLLYNLVDRMYIGHIQPTDTVGRELTVFFGVQVAPRRVGITNVECAETVSIPGLQVIPIDGPEFFEQIYMFRKRGDYLTPAGEQLERFVKSELEKCPEDPD